MGSTLRPDNEKAVSHWDSVPDMEPCPISYCDGGVVDLYIEHSQALCGRCGLAAPLGGTEGSREERTRRAAERWNELVAAIRAYQGDSEQP